MNLAIVLICDALMGEPRWLWSRFPHPAVVMGKLVSLADARLNQGALRRLKGALFVAAMVALMWALGSVLARGGALIECLLASVLMAQRSLVEHVRAVADGLRMSLAEGRFAVSMIVGRDTAQMNEAQVARAAIESAAENFSDGVVAPAFWFAVFGLPGILVYKAVNTADSMIGHRTERHEAYGWAAARFDDLLNLAPARLSAALIAAWGGQLGQWREIVSEAGRHRSPNAGWPEAAMARSLGVALSGPRAYGGQMSDEPYVNGVARQDANASDIDAACGFLWRAWAGLLGLALLLGAAGIVG